MQFRIEHTNLTVLDLEKSLKFYHEALGLREVRRIDAEDKSYAIVFLTDAEDRYRIELTWYAERDKPYDLGDNETHIAFRVDDYDAAHQKHSQMGCICFENPKMGIYFIEDPDGYWLEIIPQR